MKKKRFTKRIYNPVTKKYYPIIESTTSSKRKIKSLWSELRKISKKWTW